MPRRDRLWFDVVEIRRTARHRPGVPVFELPARDQHHRVLGVRAFVGGDEIGRDELRATGRSGEAIYEDHRVAWIAFFDTWIRDRRLLFEPFTRVACDRVPREAGDRVHAQSHLVEHLTGMRVLPVESDAPGELDDQPEILSRV